MDYDPSLSFLRRSCENSQLNSEPLQRQRRTTRPILRMVLVSVAFLPVWNGSAQGKSGPTFRTSEEIERVRRLCASEEWAIKLRRTVESRAERWLGISDDALWDLVPDETVPRALNVAFGKGCPVHGREVFRRGGHYPWVLSVDKPFKVTCPVGGEVYPTNEFQLVEKEGRERGDTTLPYADDGSGYVAPDGTRYWFVGYYVFWQRWKRDIIGGVADLTQAYLLSGDKRYAHKLAVLLGRLIKVYPRMDYRSQAYHNGKWPAGINGRILDYTWENRTIGTLGEAYDAVYSVVPDDQPLREFLRSRGITRFRDQFEQDVLQFMARDVVEGRIRGNMYYQPTLAKLALVLDNDDPSRGLTTSQMVEWILHGGGEIEAILYNGFDRDGAGGESAPGYASTWNENFCNLAEILVKLGHDITRDRKWRQLIRFPHNLALGQKYMPRLGDSGGDLHRCEPLISPTVLAFGFEHFRDRQCAQLLLKHGRFQSSLWKEALDRQEVRDVAGSASDLTDPRTRNLGGYGLAVLDSGEGSSRRLATLYYGGPDAWHGHHDRLTIAYHAHDRDFLTELGYPSHWDAKGEWFTRGMPSHYVVMIDQRRSASKRSGFLESFAAGRRARVVRAGAEAIYPGVAERYRRTLAMIDTGASSFLVDLFHVRGGSIHDYHFHGLPFGRFATAGLTQEGVQKGGTLFGAETDWGEGTDGEGREGSDPERPQRSSGYDFLRNVRRYSCESSWSIRWDGRDDCHLAYFMPDFPEVIVCDGEPPTREEHPEIMEFVVVRNRAHETMFPAVIVPYRGQNPVRDTAFHMEPGGVGYRVQTTTESWNITIGESAFRADCQRKDGSSYLFSTNVSELDMGSHHISLGQAESFVVCSVDYAAGTVFLENGIDSSGALIGEVVVIRGHGHSASYTIQGVRGRELQLDGTLLDGRVVVDEVDGTTVLTSTRLSGYGTQIASRSFAGRVMVSEDYKRAAVIEGQEGSRFKLERSLPAADTNGDGLVVFYVADVAPGYKVHVTPWVEIEHSAEGQLSVHANVPVEVE